MMRKVKPEQKARFARLRRKRSGREARRRIVRKAKRLGRLRLLAERLSFSRANNVPFDRNLERVQIVLPTVVSLHENYAATMDAIFAMRAGALREGRKVLVHFGQVERIDPAAALVLVAEIHRIRSLRSSAALTGTYPRLRSIYDLLSDMGFFHLLQISEAYGRPAQTDDPTRPIFLRFMTGRKVESELVDRFVSVVEEHLMPLNAVARGKLVAAVIEAMNNTLDHAHPTRVEGETMPHRWWMSSWINIADCEVMVMLFDQGVGIPNTLEPNRYEKIRAILAGLRTLRLTSEPSDGEMIAAATELHRTSTLEGGRGKGFRNMKQFVDVCNDGELRVLSNRGRYTYMGENEIYDNESQSLGGTIIEWRFRHDGVVEMEDE